MGRRGGGDYIKLFITKLFECMSIKATGLRVYCCFNGAHKKKKENKTQKD